MTWRTSATLRFNLYTRRVSQWYYGKKAWAGRMGNTDVTRGELDKDNPSTIKPSE